MLDIDICRYDSGLKDQLVDFLGLQWENTDIDEREKRFKWSYENNPYAKDPFIYLALHGEQIIAQRSFVIQKFVCNNHEFLVGVPADAIVHPDFRRRGLFSRLTDYAFERYDRGLKYQTLLSLSSNEASTLDNLKYGFTPVGNREFMYFFSPINGLKKIFRYNESLDNTIVSPKNSITIEITKKLRIKETSDFMQKLVEKGKIHNVRDDDFYAWQFTDSPYEHIHAYSRKGDETTGYLSLRKTDNKYYSLMEYGYLNSVHFRYLVGETFRRISAPSVIVPTFTRSQNEILDLEQSGFNHSSDTRVKLLKTLKFIPKNNLPGSLVKPVSEEFGDNAYFIDGVDVRVDKNWSLFQSDVW